MTEDLTIKEKCRIAFTVALLVVTVIANLNYYGIIK
jgi:hypothetical protein